MEPLPLSLFDYALPAELIAQEPARPRDASRLMVLPRREGAPEHRRFAELPELLGPGDLLVVNRTQVIPARLRLRRETGGKAEVLLHTPLDGDVHAARTWQGLGRPGEAFRPGRTLVAADGTALAVLDKDGPQVRVRGERPLWDLLQRVGEVPLPPYIERASGAGSADVADYQTMFAREPGAVAAPTASLHFTPEVLQRLVARGVERAELVLHVGPGTFLPVRDEHAADVRGHAMHAESYEIPQDTAERVLAAKGEGRRVVAVGTTALRALETWQQSGKLAGSSTLFIVPPFSFRAVDALLTNFHLPRSTLLMLVAALVGRERVLAAYAEAVAQRYRFFSYGDAMLIQ